MKLRDKEAMAMSWCLRLDVHDIVARNLRSLALVSIPLVAHDIVAQALTRLLFFPPKSNLLR